MTGPTDCDPFRLVELSCDLEERKMKKKSKQSTAKPRNWIAVHAFQRSGAGKHKDKSKYNRKYKHKGSHENR